MYHCLLYIYTLFCTSPTFPWIRGLMSLISFSPEFVLQMMEEIFLHLSGTNSALQAMVQILAEFASTDR